MSSGARAAAASAAFLGSLLARGVLAATGSSQEPASAGTPGARSKKKHGCSVAGKYVPGCDELRVFSGTAYPDFAAKVATHLGSSVAPANIGRFNDGEVSIKINTSVRGADVYVVQPTGPPVSDTLIELLLMVSALRNASAKRVTAVVPYFGYMRFDGGQAPSKMRRSTAKTSVPIDDDDIGDEIETHRTSFLAMADVAKMFEVAGTSRLVTVDLHSSGQSVSEGFFTETEVELLRSGPYVVRSIIDQLGLESKSEELVVVAPHSQCFTKAKKFQAYFREALGRPVGLALVVRSPGKNEQDTRVDLVGDVKGKHVVVVEDVVDTGRSLTRATRAAIEAGALNVDAFASHAVLGRESFARIMNSRLGHVLVLDTLPISPSDLGLCPKLKVIDISRMVSSLIMDLHLATD